ncbi:hypothetical protein [Caballeronia sp. J97]|uniref:hypothetical protein n=1 Tax=Caballeronia sp. J97 TaxID=2805429 RepID=UPI002AB1E078|nr:hypothetical protein [Caballeronia sp. J97]
MSDGPHRSLPLRRAWKELAKRGDESTYDATSVAEAAKDALASDFRKEVKYAVIKALKDVFSGVDNSLGLPELALEQLEHARTLAAGSVFGLNAVAWGIHLVHEGRLDESAFHEALGFAAKDRGFANARSMEEHYVRKSTELRAKNVAFRVNAAVAELPERQLGLALLAPKPSKFSLKKSGLSDGVPLR